ncbi:cysteine proteinase inhibitor B [Alnus glutinosa]|jgi:cystatin-C|uniref:cysteine proteinase inhibitor B n=1 Tax=Alnus glutinosa TaxID=3517 RepID=UPI002D76A2A4|nr:cysteine proteinase inhibitor B [Alnus glutinosa]
MAMIRSPAGKLATVTLFSLVFLSAYGYDGMVGGRTEVKDVKTNEEVQKLGRFSVHEYNRSLRHRGNGDGGRELTFVEVVEAQSQVVSGIKYYLKISATQSGVTKIFESVVVVKPWVHSKELLNFGPSTPAAPKIVPIRF